jgi:hypothetical protein
MPREMSTPPPRPQLPPALLQAFVRARDKIRESTFSVSRAVTAWATATVPRALGRARDAVAKIPARAMQARKAEARTASPPAVTAPRDPKAKASALRRNVAIAVALTVVVLVAAGAFVALRPPPTPVVTFGTASIDATPWATVTAIVSDDGLSQPLPEDPSTPLSLRLPVGSYRITLVGPQSATQELRVTILDGTTATVPTTAFGVMSAEDYFKPYLESRPQGEASDTVGATEPAATSAAVEASR